MESLAVRAPAKINLRLEILGKRPDGYHELSTIFQKIALFDELTITKTGTPGICLEVNQPDIPADRNNLVWRAAELILARCPEAGVSLRLHKNIPSGAGLGGGSSDAAAALLGCNMLFGLGLSPQALMHMGLRLGADVPFFLSPWDTANATGVGEMITGSHLEADLWFIIVFPRCSISTAWAYETYSKDIVLTKKAKNIKLPSLIANVSELALLLHNDFEHVVLPRYREIERIKDHLLQAGAAGALLSGSGSSVFGVFESQQVCSDAAGRLAERLESDIFIAPNYRQARHSSV